MKQNILEGGRLGLSPWIIKGLKTWSKQKQKIYIKSN